MPQRRFLAFDLGAESGRAVLGLLDKGKLALEEKQRFSNPTGRMNGHLHWDLLAQWEELKNGLRKTVHNGEKLDGIGIDTWGVDFGLLARGGELLGFPYHYRDARTNGMMEKAFERVPRERIFETTGIQFMQFNTLFQLVAMREAGSRVLDTAETLLFMPDLFNFLFTGERKSEFSIATTSQMFDPRKNAWATEMLKELDIPPKMMPPVVPSGTVIGPIRKDVAEECAVGGIPVIAPACHDTGSAVAAVPAEGEDWCYISSGTWSLMGVELEKPLINDKALELNYTNEGGVGGSIRFLKNIMGLWLVQECRRQWEARGEELGYDELTRLAEQAPPFAAVIDPDHNSFLMPGEMPQKIANFCRETKQTPPPDKGQVVRTCLESLALTYRFRLEGLQEVLGRNMRVIHVVGGGARNELLNQMTADACGLPVVAGPYEATSIGNILVQAMAAGEISSLADARAIVRASFDVKRYEPQPSPKWQKAYERYSELRGKS